MWKALLYIGKEYGWIISLLVQGFIAYHVFFLSKKISIRSRLEHRERMKQIAENWLHKIYREKLNSEVYLVNIQRYFKDYPSNEEKLFGGYSHLRAEIKAVRFDGIEFFSGMPVEVYKKTDGSLSLKGKKEEWVFNALPVGIVPYEWIEHIDLVGDDCAYVPLFYCYFKGKTNWKFWKRFLFFGYPYKRSVYYKLNDHFQEGSDPYDMKYSLIREPISQE